jgi:alkanesulfonate monooxygenase SsuD/methylene tetrahydromethanopterin reductase-like flavin-dependent oxidoreductase (luciferase family)
MGETTIFPKSLQRPHPPIWLAAQTEESFEASVRLGLRTFTSGSARPVEIVERNWGYFCDARDKHQTTSPIHFAVQQQLCVAPTDAEARTQMEHFRYGYRQVANLRAGSERIEAGHAFELPVEGEPTLDQFLETHTLSGSPETVRAKIEAYRRAAPGLSQLNCTFTMGAMEPEVVRRSMRLFAEEVMPHFR